MSGNDDERDRAMFGPDDRKYLRGEKEYATDQGVYDRRATIRGRVQDGIVDFSLVQENMSRWNWQKFVDDIRENEHEVQKNEIRVGMTSAIAFFYEIHEAMGWDFERTLWDALNEAYTHGVAERNLQNRTVDGVDFGAQLIEPDNNAMMENRIEEKLEDDKPLTEWEIGWAAKHSPRLLEEWDSRDKRDSLLAREDRALRKVSGESGEE